MKIKLLVATDDNGYADHLSGFLAEYHADTIEVSVCRSAERLRELLKARKFDAALLEASLIEGVELSAINLPLLLWTGEEKCVDAPEELRKLHKYQRITSIITCVFEQFAKVSKVGCGSDPGKAAVTAVWSPGGGVGKTSVALAFAAKKAAEGKQAMYLNLEVFSSVPAFFNEKGKSISTVFEMLENREGDVKTLIRGIRRQDGGIAYFCRPDNFDDMNILSADNVSALATACAGVTDELIVDMSCVCDERTRRIFEIADKIFIVTDPSLTTQTKLFQFFSQHNVFSGIKGKAVLVANKGAVISEPPTDEIIRLPYVQSANASAVYKTLSGSFEA